MKLVMATAFTLDVTVEAFDAAAQLAFREGLAAKLRSVSLADLSLEDVRIVSVTAGSLVVKTEIIAPTQTAAAAATTYLEVTPAASLSADLGVSVAAVSAPVVQAKAYSAPSPPPPSPPPSPPPTPPPPMPPPPTPPPPSPPPPSLPPPSLPPTPESSALTALFESAGGTHWACVECDTSDVHVVGLHLRDANLTGNLPAELGTYATRLQQLDLRNNSLDYPGAQDPIFETAVLACTTLGATCLGIPPQGCSAFRGRYVISMTNPNVCDECTPGGWILTLVGVGIGLGFAPLMLALYMCALRKYPDAIRRWLSTVIIIVNHAQTISIIATLRLSWPKLIVDLMRLVTFAFFIFDFDGVACIPLGSDEVRIGTSAGIAFWVSNLALCGLIFTVLIVLVILIQLASARAAVEERDMAKAAETARSGGGVVAKGAAQPTPAVGAAGEVTPGVPVEKRSAALVDWLVLLLSVILSTLFTTAMRFSLKAIDGSQRHWSSRTSFEDGLDSVRDALVLAGCSMAVALLCVLLLLLAYMSVLVHTFQRGSSEGNWSLRAAVRSIPHLLAQSPPPCRRRNKSSKTEGDDMDDNKGDDEAMGDGDDVKSNDLAKRRQERLERRQKLDNASWISPLRLEKRVAYLTRRFARHAPRWQLVVWLRQTVLTLLSFFLEVILPRFSQGSPPFLVARYGLGGLALLVMLVAWWYHHRTQPFFLRYQNSLESWLYFSDVGLLLASMVYTRFDEVLTQEAAADGLRDVVATRALIERVFEAIMAFTFLAGIAAFAVYLGHDLRSKRKLVDMRADSAEILDRANKRIDGKVKDSLAHGHIRLLRCEWLLTEGEGGSSELVSVSSTAAEGSARDGVAFRSEPDVLRALAELAAAARAPVMLHRQDLEALDAKVIGLRWRRPPQEENLEEKPTHGTEITTWPTADRLSRILRSDREELTPGYIELTPAELAEIDPAGRLTWDCWIWLGDRGWYEPAGAGAFFSPREAAELFESGDRSVLALTYGWQTADHPDPQGSTLQMVRNYLERDAARATYAISECRQLRSCGLFWECVAPLLTPTPASVETVDPRGILTDRAHVRLYGSSRTAG